MVRLIYPPRCELFHDWTAQHPRRDRGAHRTSPANPSVAGRMEFARADTSDFNPQGRAHPHSLGLGGTVARGGLQNRIRDLDHGGQP